ncbi:hypothetical protein NWQ33_04705 [Mycoplasmopsis cynos]|nr:hypothetical protein [Mycoplasmopsis cynos]
MIQDFSCDTFSISAPAGTSHRYTSISLGVIIFSLFPRYLNFGSSISKAFLYNKLSLIFWFISL